MLFRTKLTIGLGFLFLIIFALAVYSSYNIQQLSKEADKILRDNYNSLVYCKNMLLALEDMTDAVSGRIFAPEPDKSAAHYVQLFTAGQTAFESSFSAEKNNITEEREREYVEELNAHYNRCLSFYAQINKTGDTAFLYFNDFLPTRTRMRLTISKINDLNMQAIVHKNQSTRHDAEAMIISMAVVGAICVLLAFFYFWYFPFYISNTLSHLVKRMRTLLQRADIKIETETSDEALLLLHSIDLLENKLIKF